MLSFEEAYLIALCELEKLNANSYGDPYAVTDCVLVDKHILTKPYGWIFVYNSKRFLETKDIGYGLLGNAPFIVNRYDGSVTVTSTAHELKHYLAEYEKEHGY
ncbi:YrhB domain-containing protein [Hymenobacter persicinus]|uniref:Immunity protein 35 domain-containing protein n=1 Tax=Hymenobacter persicinus TaxID=2025506 RepID=A0A4Q5LCF1_9BACT|nr:YrhB domain-containing protein [Hymenobacter persicinus]RYU80451.1 hypothetical protein EWM57_08120 [Hymenobacter persicinus]